MQYFTDIGDMGADRFHAEEERVGNFLVTESICKVGENFLLPPTGSEYAITLADGSQRAGQRETGQGR